MRKRPGNPATGDVAPADPARLAPYDYEHVVTYWRMLDAETDGADWQEVAQLLLHISIPSVSQGARGRLMKVTLRVPNG
jgi:hypothetical protein